MEKNFLDTFVESTKRYDALVALHELGDESEQIGVAHHDPSVPLE